MQIQHNDESKSSRKNPVIHSIRLLTYLFIQQVFIECLLYAKHYVGTGMQ